MNPFAALIDLILPRECHICSDKLAGSEKFICHSCATKLPVTGYDRYWANKSGLNTDLNPMEQRFAGQIPLERAYSPYFYMRDSALASLVHDFKYRKFPDLAATLGKIGAELLLNSQGDSANSRNSIDFFEGIDIMLPVPLHWWKRLKRGYNQTEMIALGVSGATGIPVGRHLRAWKPHRTQTSLSAEQRIANTKGVFTLDKPEDLRGKHILLVDDICTTGATLLSAGNTVAASLNNEVRISIFTLGVV